MLARRALLPARALLAMRYDGKLAELNAWILQEEADYLGSKGESKSLDDVSGAAPLKLYGVAGRYATGLYNSAVKAKELGKVDADLKKLVAAANTSATVASFLSSPTVSRADRTKGIEGVATALGLCTTTKHFLGVLASSSRTKFLMPIAHSFGALTASASGELTVTLTAARVLPDLEEKAIVDSIKQEFFPWQKVRIVRMYDPELIKGYIVDYGDKILDKSYGNKLKKIKAALSGVGA
ncbi:hypothetical protein KFE25_009849 [Diacronema lutheri]|uniref:ATP synthase subunit O, mitochondrial n=1 Tax=Diacronema lutheri TaxID=2081491 RepID=A0A8J6C0Y7_DIALT|nr:hypothetical protein KFE25_009849 [Diacronema lutheri]